MSRWVEWRIAQENGPPKVSLRGYLQTCRRATAHAFRSFCFI